MQNLHDDRHLLFWERFPEAELEIIPRERQKHFPLIGPLALVLATVVDAVKDLGRLEPVLDDRVVAVVALYNKGLVQLLRDCFGHLPVGEEPTLAVNHYQL